MNEFVIQLAIPIYSWCITLIIMSLQPRSLPATKLETIQYSILDQVKELVGGISINEDTLIIFDQLSECETAEDMIDLIDNELSLLSFELEARKTPFGSGFNKTAGQRGKGNKVRRTYGKAYTYKQIDKKACAYYQFKQALEQLTC